MTDKYDSLYLTIAQSAGSVDLILDSFFSFLSRKTDFLHRPDLAKAKIDEALGRVITASKSAKPQTPKIEEVEEISPPQTKTIASTTSAPNGGVTDRYRWTQTLSTVDVFITLPGGVRARDLEVEVTSDTLHVAVKGTNTMLAEGQLHAKVKDSTWTVDQQTLQLSLDKQDGMKWWTCVLVGDTEIDTQQIVPENSKLSDLDSETRAMVEKMMFDQNQKARGLPTSDQLKQHDMLEKFKKAHPEMDFSNAKVNFGGSSGL